MYLGFDLGTSGMRALLTDEGGAPLGSAEAPLNVARPRDGWAEQDPEDWIATAKTCVAALRRAHDLAPLKGVAVAGHMHGAVALDAAGEVIRPCILWNDTRAAVEAAALDAAPGVRAAFGNIVFPGFTAPKLAWMAAHEPDAFARVATVMSPKDYVARWLSGAAATEMSDAAGTAWLDVAARDWSDALLSAGGMTRARMPALHEGAAEIGRLRPALSADWGVAGTCAVAAGAADNAAAACGIGAVTDGAGFVSLGTSGVTLIARGAAEFAPETAVHSFAHAIPAAWIQMSVMLSATDSLNWAARLTGRRPGDLAAMVPARAKGPGEALFLPYLGGERTPHNDAAARGALIGLGHAHGPAEIARAVMEGVAFGMADGLTALRTAGAAPERLFAIGGGTRSRFWVETLATLYGLPLDLPASGEFGAAMGAARLARAAATGEDPRAYMTPPAAAETVEPGAPAPYEAARARFAAAYPAIRSLP